MKILVLAFICVVSFTQTICAQSKVTSAVGTTYRPDRSKPSVYLTFERLGGNKPLVKSNEDNSERISLRLRNNTTLPITVEANYEVDKVADYSITLSDGGKVDALPDGAEVEVCYEAEAQPQMTAQEYFKIQVPKQIPSYYSCKWQAKRRGRGNVWIPAGSSIIFSVPQEFLAKGLKIYTLINYEWESDKGQMKANEPHHQVYFYSNDLPYALRLR